MVNKQQILSLITLAADAILSRMGVGILEFRILKERKKSYSICLFPNLFFIFIFV